MKTKIISLIALMLFSLSSCESFLDRPPLAEENDDVYWTSEVKVRMYANSFYPRYLTGYNSGNGAAYTAHVGYTFNDDVTSKGSQTSFDLVVPATQTSPLDPTVSWLTKHTAPSWTFAWVRKSNIMLDRVTTRMSGILDDATHKHWMALARFFRAMEYAGLVSTFGDVPYYDHEVSDVDFDDMYKPRTPRNEVMDAVYEDFKYALTNVKENDGVGYINRDVVATLVSRLALYEGTWQKYHENNSEQAKKFLTLAMEAADMVRGKSKYSFKDDFRSLFGSEDLSKHSEVIFYRHYKSGMSDHAVASSCNFSEGRTTNGNLALIKSFICQDGTDWQTSTQAENKDFEYNNLIKTRDSRFEATFFRELSFRSQSTCLYTAKFIPREAFDYLNTPNGALDTKYTGNKNENAYPVLRLAEVALNWVEAKAELATLGGIAVSQDDIDMSINKIRSRDIAPEAAAKGVTKTKNLELAKLPSTPVTVRGDVSQLIWEIRRERRMEFAFEHSRLLDLKRWKKLEYMDATENPDILRGAWIKATDPNLGFVKDGAIEARYIGLLAVADMNGKVTIFDGKNADKMVGFYAGTEMRGRQPFLNITGINPYLAPVGTNQINDYAVKGYELKQTEGWAAGY